VIVTTPTRGTICHPGANTSHEVISDEEWVLRGGWMVMTWCRYEALVVVLVEVDEARSRQRRDLIWKGEMFVKNKTKVVSSLLFNRTRNNSVLEELRVKRFAVVQKIIRWKVSLRWVMLESKSGGWKEKNS